MKLSKLFSLTSFLSCSMLAVVSSCSHTPTFGEHVKGEGNEVAAIGKNWEKGNAMIAKGKKLEKEGESMQRSGRKNISKGEDMVKAGEKLKSDSEAAYKAAYKARSANPSAEG